MSLLSPTSLIDFGPEDAFIGPELGIVAFAGLLSGLDDLGVLRIAGRNDDFSDLHECFFDQTGALIRRGVGRSKTYVRRWLGWRWEARRGESLSQASQEG